MWKTDLAPVIHGPAPRLSLTVTYTLARPRRGDQPGQRFDVETVSPPIEVELPLISFDIAPPTRPSASSFTPWNLVP